MSKNTSSDLSLHTIRMRPDGDSHLNSTFRKATGMPVHQYVIRRRVERAALLLREGTLPISQIAMDVGFAHQSHLAMHMKRLLGLSPSHVLLEGVIYRDPRTMIRVDGTSKERLHIGIATKQSTTRSRPKRRFWGVIAVDIAVGHDFGLSGVASLFIPRCALSITENLITEESAPVLSLLRGGFHGVDTGHLLDFRVALVRCALRAKFLTLEANGDTFRYNVCADRLQAWRLECVRSS